MIGKVLSKEQKCETHLGHLCVRMRSTLSTQAKGMNSLPPQGCGCQVILRLKLLMFVLDYEQGNQDGYEGCRYISTG